jgi:hypothetical protein
MLRPDTLLSRTPTALTPKSTPHFFLSLQSLPPLSSNSASPKPLQENSDDAVTSGPRE